MPSVLKQQVCIASSYVLGPVVFMLAVTTNNQKCYQTETSNLIKSGLKHEDLWHFFFFINNSLFFYPQETTTRSSGQMTLFKLKKLYFIQPLDNMQTD